MEHTCGNCGFKLNYNKEEIERYSSGYMLQCPKCYSTFYFAKAVEPEPSNYDVMKRLDVIENLLRELIPPKTTTSVQIKTDMLRSADTGGVVYCNLIEEPAYPIAIGSVVTAFTEDNYFTGIFILSKRVGNILELLRS